jgi:hypothetical protein
MKMILKYLIPCIIPLLSLAYGFGDHFQCWDNISGRTMMYRAYERLLGDGYPESFIYSDEPEFLPLEQLINKNTKNKQLSEMLKNGEHPSLISIDGGMMMRSKAPNNWPKSNFVPEPSIIFCFYGTGNKDNDEGIVMWAGSIGELKDWIEERRNKERFWISTVFISILGIWLGIITSRDEKKGTSLSSSFSKDSNEQIPAIFL